MLETVSTLRHFGIHATDGDIGKVVNVFFDDKRWTVRYFVVETGGWLHRRRVLISPIAIVSLDVRARRLAVDLTRDQIAQSPSVKTNMPLSRQMELKYREYYSWPLYWVETYLDAYGTVAYPGLAAADRALEAGRAKRRESLLPRPPHGDPHLRSARAITGYAVVATDGLAGQLEDFMVDSKRWVIRSLVVQASRQKHRLSVLISPDLVRDMNWAASSIHLGVSRREVLQSTPYQLAAAATSSRG